MSHPDQPLLQVRNLCVTFQGARETVTAAQGVSFDLRRGRTLFVIGESGSGKTVSCRALLGLLPATASVSGSVRLDGKELLTLSEGGWRAVRSQISIVLQDASRALNPTMTVGRQIIEAILQHEKLKPRAATDRAMALLDQLRVPDPAGRFHAYPHELSGGMRQRVLIAIAIAGHPSVLIADEATRSLDALVQAETLELLADLQRRLGMALIMVSHDLKLAIDFADEVLVMYGGRVVERASARRLFHSPRMHYTQALLAAAPDARQPPHSTFPVVPGQPPSMTDLPRGCAFEPRCTAALPCCREQRPLLESDAGGRAWACWRPLPEKGPA